MKNLAQCLQQHLPFSVRLLVSAVLVAGIVPAHALTSQTSSATSLASPAIRISAEISGSERTPLPGSQRPQALAQFDSGRLVGATKLQGISIYFNRTQSQEADLQALMAAQQNPSSPQYHQWLNPEQFASRFGMADADIAKVENWLEQQGFSIDSVARGKNVLRFSGTAAQVETAFSTELHTYNVPTSKGVVKHFAPSTALSVPSAIAGVVEGIRNLDDFRPRSHAVKHAIGRAKPNFTQDFGGTQYVFFAPGDIFLQYDIQNEYNASFKGTGQSIAIVGQSAVQTSDLEAFWTAASITRQDPEMDIVAGTGDPTLQPDGDEAESDLDLEWSGAIAQGANLHFVFTGSDTNYGAFDSIQYAIDNQIGTIISSSYGSCETDLGGQTLETVLEQAATQGQTVLSAAGDDGSTDCFGDYSGSGSPTAAEEALAVDYPASSPNVTGVGGTEVSQANAAYLTAPSAYWEAATSSSPTVTTSLLQVVPEQAWNEDTICLQGLQQDPTSGQSPVCAGGGGASALFKKPSYQTALTPADNQRDVPDLSLDAALSNPGYLFCTSDQSFWISGQAASCNSGFLDATTGDPTAAGGTSFATPIFAGMLALINQQQGYTTGQGLINPTLYTLASNSGTYATAFRDITTGDNKCDSGSSYCSSQGESEFSAGTGYDQATGLGTVDLFNLAAAWPKNSAASAALIATTTTVTASNTTPAVSASDTFTITVAPATGSGSPAGTVSITVDPGTTASTTPVTETLASNGTYVYTASFTTTGTHVVLVNYSGDSTYAASTGQVSVDVAGTSSGSGSFKLAATNLTVSQGSSGSSTITVTPAGGYTGTVDISFDTSNDSALQNLCYEFTSSLSDGDGAVIVSNATAVTTQLSFDTNAADCASTGAVRKSGKHAFRSMHKAGSDSEKSNGGLKTTSAAMAFAGLLLTGFLGRSSRKLRGLACLMVLAAIGMAVTACGGGSSNTISDPPKGTYTVTLSGSDTSSATIPTATTTFTFTIQ